MSAEVLLCLNSEWQGCESPELEGGSRRVAREVFGDAHCLDLGPAGRGHLGTRGGVFALETVAARFRQARDALALAHPERIFTVGGTCGAEAAPVAYLAGRYDDFGAVWFDAHGDMNTPATSPSGHFHGMVLRTLLGEGPAELTGPIPRPIQARRVVVAGARDLDRAEREYISAADVGLVEGWPIDVSARIVASLREAGVRRLYVHLDVDVFDPSDYGDALFSVPGGPSLASAASAVREVVGAFDVVGVGLVESCGREPRAAAVLKEFLVDCGLQPAVWRARLESAEV